jgi:endonuclease YncB( thermonuclease family)
VPTGRGSIGGISTGLISRLRGDSCRELITGKMKFWLHLVYFATVASLMGHPGGLDEDGGHTDKQSGQYHVHRPQTTTSQTVRKSNEVEIVGKVVGVHDGDTLTLLVDGNREVKVRLDGIDAPELGQPFGKNAKAALSATVFEKTVTVKVGTTDRYGRTVGRIFLNGQNVNLGMVRSGLAWWYRQYASKDEALEIAEEYAKTRKEGLWADPQPIAPWEWRKKR